MESPFDVLLIGSDADEETIEEAYRQRILETHPDQGGSLEEFQAVRAAYERLQAGYQEPVGVNQDRSDQPRKQDWYRQATSQVRYVDYDVLTDFGWETDDPDLFEKAAAADLGEEAYGTFEVEPDEFLLEAAEARGFAWPFACRGGACANCAIKLVEGDLSMPASHVLTDELMDRGFRLSCNGIPITDELGVVFNVKHMAELEELLLPPRPFKQAHDDD